MKLEMNEYGELTLDPASFIFWISSGDPTVDEHPPTGCRIEIDHQDVYIKLTPENADRLLDALTRASSKFKGDASVFEHVRTDFVLPE